LARLTYDQLPSDIKNKYTPKDIHKIVKPSQTIISVHTRHHIKDIWIKAGNTWLRQEKETIEDVHNI
jgi:hypothetical protein